MKSRKSGGMRKNHLVVVVLALLISILTYVVVSAGRPLKNKLNEIDLSSAQSACNTSFFTVQSPAGETFTKSCIISSGQMYSGDSRFQFFLPVSPYLSNAYVLTSNSPLKDNKSLSWSITTQSPATVYIMTRHIPGLNQIPGWVSSSYTRKTNDDLSQINQYFKRKNEQGLIGIYDIFARDVGAGTVQLGPASDAAVTGFSMYITVVVPRQATSTPSPTPTRSPSPTPTRSPSPSPTATSDPLLAEAALHHTANDCYVVYSNPEYGGRHLYNVTDYIKFHPGSTVSIASGCGTDITQRYDNGDPAYLEAGTNIPHKHTKASNEILKLFLVK